MILCVIFVVLMILWLFGGGWTVYAAPAAATPQAWAAWLLPWVCVAILGWVVFGGGAGPVVVVPR